MKIYNTIILKKNKKQVKIDFGIPDNKEEIEKMFRLRFKVYSEKKYIDQLKYPDQIEKDEYDESDKSVYFICQINNEIIATARLIKTIPLPTQLYFDFEESEVIKKISPEKRAEIGRLIVIPYNISSRQYLPRHIVMLFLFKTILDYMIENDYQGGYAFVKTTLFKKLRSLKIPFHLIENYKQKYPPDGQLYLYFNDQNDPVVPIYYLTSEEYKYFSKIFNNYFLFKKNTEKEFFLNNFNYSFFIYINKLFNNFLNYFKKFFIFSR